MPVPGSGVETRCSLPPRVFRSAVGVGPFPLAPVGSAGRKDTMTETETETVETPEEVHDPAAVLRKNRELLSDLKAAKERTSSLEELARTLGGDEALADPKAFLGKRAETAKAEGERARVVREAALKTIATEQRVIKRDIEEALSAIVADPESKVDDAGKVSLGKAFERVAPKKAAPVNPSNPVRGWDETTGTYRSSSAGPASFEELQKLGASAVESFASKSPEAFAKLRDDWQRRLANPGARR